MRKNPFEHFETVPPIIAFIWRTEGAEGVEGLLALLKDVLAREDLDEATVEFRQLGLLNLAKITKRWARRAKPRPSLDPPTRWLVKGGGQKRSNKNGS
ncbi:MAG TPA: hypothetical protein VKW08_07435 [Xanthobacteraceae bacterium]|jgi:hypothetical protein|nr:hypothetical protein [Xanthobacteraceae bacterium]